jgi:hypothetical protein
VEVPLALLSFCCQRIQSFFSCRVKADNPLRARVRNASYGGACKMLSRGISFQMLTFFLQTLHPLNCRSADILFRKSKRLLLFHKVLNGLSYFYDTLWYLDFCLVHTTVFINTNSLFFFVQVTKWTDSSNALDAVMYCLCVNVYRTAATGCQLHCS